MKTPVFFSFAFLFAVSLAAPATDEANENFLQCLSSQFQNEVSQVIYTPSNPSFLPILNFSAQNLRHATPETPKPRVIITPLQEPHVAKAIYCCRKYGIQTRTRSGGHDFEGLSYVSEVPFAVIDLFKLRTITVDAKAKTAWVQTGATLGEVYYAIANASRTLGFPAGICPTVGTGGHIAGGGYGNLVRRDGLAADHVIDARIVDCRGRIINKKLMGEDLFWAIRGGGGGSFGVIVAWKIELVQVPEIVTVFTVTRSLEQNASNLIYKWQSVAPKTDQNLFIRIYIRNANSSEGGRTITASFSSLFLGKTDDLLALMQKEFPELGLKREDCTEMAWIDSALYFIQGGDSVEYLRNRSYPYKSKSKAKADFVRQPIPLSAWEGIWERLRQEDLTAPLITMTPFGGKMDEISPSERPFPHRAGNLYLIDYQVDWLGGNDTDEDRHLSWVRELYDYMTPYVSKNPRVAYLNYRDLDIGVNNVEGNTSIAQASKFGIKYFLKNFYRLIKAKTAIDPSNYFRHEQSIPALTPALIREIGQHSPESKASV